VKDMGARADVTPFFLDRSGRRLLCVYYRPAASTRQRGDILSVPAFAEEMNRCRRMVALQSRSLALVGIGVLTVDVSGTGDSTGDFGDARWENWIEDLSAAIEWLSERGRTVFGYWGIRSGCLLANSLLAKKKIAAERLIFWQPVVDGAAMITQVLRMRVAAKAFEAGEAKETTQLLRQQLAAGEPIEVAGYRLAPELVSAIEGQQLNPQAGPMPRVINWLEVVSEPSRPLAPASQMCIDGWRNRGIEVTTDCVAGQPFWSSLDQLELPALVDATLLRVGSV
jgi:exosortase A-associated hydrolase 2